MACNNETQNWIYGDEWVCPKLPTRGPHCQKCSISGVIHADVGVETIKATLATIRDIFKQLSSDKIPIDFEGLDEEEIKAINEVYPEHDLVKFSNCELYMLRAKCAH